MPPPFSKKFPFFLYDPEGFGFLWASPVFIFVFIAVFHYIQTLRNRVLKYHNNTELSSNDITVMTGAAVSGILISLTIFTIMGTGWVQFASRYSLDYQLMMLLFGLFVVKKWKNSKMFMFVSIVLLLMAIYMNFFGVRYHWYFLEFFGLI
jgi:hypothetical protein